MDLSTDDIIHGLKSGNRKIFEKVFKKYYTLLCFEARGYIKSDDLIEEIVCDVFTRVWQNRETLVIKTSLRDYLIKAVHNKSIDYYRQLKRQETFKASMEEKGQSLYTLMDLGETPLDYILTQELEERIHAVIESLPPQYKRAFKLSRNNELSYEEIATEMQISVNSVKTNIKNALAFLRIELNDLFILLLAFFLKIFY
jgi:RNA polymerase sigma-70 factor, ECF subfamily